MCVFYFSCPESTHAFLKLDANSRLAWGRCVVYFSHPISTHALLKLSANSMPFLGLRAGGLV